jgi:hypothetical protein
VRTFATASTALLFAALAAQANTVYTFHGNLNDDDDVIFFHYTIQNTGPVHVYTTSYGTGTPGSGFLPILTIFDNPLPEGNWLFEDTGTYAENRDANIGGDPLHPWNAAAGTTYWVYITEYGNSFDQSTNDWTYADDPSNSQFTQDLEVGLPNIGTGPFQGPGADGNGAQLTDQWTVVFDSADPTFFAAEPEPATWTLFACGVLALGCFRKFRLNR